jgi:hypothetical protein
METRCCFNPKLDIDRRKSIYHTTNKPFKKIE